MKRFYGFVLWRIPDSLHESIMCCFTVKYNYFKNKSAKKVLIYPNKPYFCNINYKG